MNDTLNNNGNENNTPNEHGRNEFDAAELFSLLHRAARFMIRSHHHHGHGRHAQWHVLSILNEKGSLNQRELMEMLHVRSASLSELLAKIERAGFIIRERDEEDKRNFVIRMTEQGKEAMTAHMGEHAAGLEAPFAALSEDERRQLGGTLNKLLAAMEESMPEREPGHGRHGHGCPGHGYGGHGRDGHEHGERGPRGRGRRPHGHDFERPGFGHGECGRSRPDEEFAHECPHEGAHHGHVRPHGMERPDVEAVPGDGRGRRGRPGAHRH